MGQVRKTPHLLAVVGVLIHDPDRAWYGLELSEEIGMRPGNIYPILARLTAAGWVLSEWEADPPQGRPRRRYHRLTDLGREAAREALAAAPAYLLSEDASALRGLGLGRRTPRYIAPDLH